MSGILRMIGEHISLSGLSRFLNKWPWSPEEVTQTWMNRFRERVAPMVQAEHDRLRAEKPKRIGRPKTTVVTGYLIIDDSVHTKPKGKKMGGLGAHYSNTDRKVVSGHCLVTGLYVLLGRRCPLQPRMYRQRSVCETEGEPFQSKIDMAVAEIEQFEPVSGTQTHVLVDIWFHSKRVRKAAQKRDFDISGGLKSNRVIRLIATDGSREWLPVSKYAVRLKREDWVEVNWPSAEGGQKKYAHLVHTWIRKLGPTLLLITCHNPDEPLTSIRYWGSTNLNLDAQSLVNVLAVRWEVETFFEYEKDLLGSDHYQVMTAKAILRIWTLTACMMCFLEEQRSEMKKPRATCGDARRLIQKDHCKNLLFWLHARFREGFTIEQTLGQLAL